MLPALNPEIQGRSQSVSPPIQVKTTLRTSHGARTDDACGAARAAVVGRATVSSNNMAEKRDTSRLRDEKLDLIFAIRRQEASE
jgi:hypothetical protein